MTEAQRLALTRLCTNYQVPFDPEHYKPAYDLPEGWLAGWVGGSPDLITRTIYVGCSPEGEISS